MYTIDEIKKLIYPVAQQYGVGRVALFGSYAQGKASDDSDIDLHIESGDIKGYFRLAGFHRELEEQLKKPVDVLTTGMLSEDFLKKIERDEVVIYD